MNIKEAYNNWSDTYDSDRNLTRDLDRVITKKILANSKYKSVVEFGCGTGKNTIFLSKIADKVYATDFSSGMLEKAKAKINSPKVIFTVADITKQWIYDEESADLVICNLVLEHIENLQHIFSEAYRILTEGGYFFISELHPFRQYKGTKANFQKDREVIEIQAFLHHTSDFFNIGKDRGFVVDLFQEFWHEQDRDKNKPPRIISFLFRK